MKWGVRLLLTGLCAIGLAALCRYEPQPVWRILGVWMAVVFAGTLVRFIYHLFRPNAMGAPSSGMDSVRMCIGGTPVKGSKRVSITTKRDSATAWLGTVWAIAQTFTFITFTRLFFRSGSNLDPATANQVAWETARNMVSQIGCAGYWKVFVLVIAGMVIHLLPARWKRRYRLGFAKLPIPLMAAVAAAAVFILYQFVTADTQPFIYFQF